MNITIKITSAEQCFSCIRQLLHYYPSLSLTITSDETIPASARPPQTDCTDAHIRAYVAACICSIYPRADPSRFRDAIDKTYNAGFSRLDSDSDTGPTRAEASRAAADAAWTKFKDTQSAARRAASADAADAADAADEALREADAIRSEVHRRLDNPDAREDLDYTDKP